VFGPNDASRVHRLRKVVAALAAVQDLAGLIDAVLGRTADAIGAKVASLSVMDRETGLLHLVAIEGAVEATMRRWAAYPLSGGTPAGEALLEGRLVVMAGREAIEARYPDLAGQVIGDGTLLCLPLIAGDRPLGVISVSTPDRWAPDGDETESLWLFADTCAQALERVQALGQAQDHAEKLTFLAAASAELAGSLDYNATLATVARLAVPTIADWCTVEIVDDGRFRTVAVAHVDPDKVALAQQLQKRYPTDPDAPAGSANVVRTGRSELHPVISDELLSAATRDEEHLRIARELQLRSALTVPLLARDRILGAITLIFAESGRTYGSEDVAFAEDLARRAAVAIDNAQLHSQTRDAARRLQRAVLPADLTSMVDWEIATFTNPAGRTDVGGDFYDAIPIPDGRLSVVIGDVMGRGVAAAAAMAHMRAAVHAYIALDPDPVAVMTDLDLMFARFGYSKLVSMAYLLLDPTACELTLVNAGHCPPLLIDADGAVEVLRDAPSPLLGVNPVRRAVATHTLKPGTVLLTYTDGLIERRGEDIDASIARLACGARVLTAGQLAAQLPVLIESVGDPQRDDDVTAMAIARRE
jgi:serine phosphatase RsbU (regulator of sigma subunit)